MSKGFKRYSIVVLGLLVCLISTPSLIVIKSVLAQHIDIFKLAEPAKRGKVSGETGIIKVEDRYSYEVPVEKDKIDKNEVLRTDVELIELEDKDKALYQWHHVEIFEERDVTQVHTRIVGNLKCMRKRTGTIFWVPDGNKYVIWQTWSGWDCAKGE